jgi:Fe2+ transport system protein FeoA
MSDRSSHSPERRALFLTLGALGAGLRPVLAGATDRAEAETAGVDRPRPPIIIKGGSFYVAIADGEPDFKNMKSPFYVPASKNKQVQDFSVAVMAGGLNVALPGFTDMSLTVRSSIFNEDTVTLRAEKGDGLSVTSSSLEKRSDGPDPGYKRRLMHRGFGPGEPFRIARVQATGPTLALTHEDPMLNYTLSILLHEV